MDATPVVPAEPRCVLVSPRHTPRSMGCATHSSPAPCSSSPTLNLTLVKTHQGWRPMGKHMRNSKKQQSEEEPDSKSASPGLTKCFFWTKASMRILKPCWLHPGRWGVGVSSGCGKTRKPKEMKSTLLVHVPKIPLLSLGRRRPEPEECWVLLCWH